MRAWGLLSEPGPCGELRRPPVEGAIGCVPDEAGKAAGARGKQREATRAQEMVALASLTEIGALAGLVSFFWLAAGAFKRWLHRPRIAIRPFDRQRDLRTLELGENRYRSVFTVEVCNLRSHTAMRCVGVLTVTKWPANVRLAEKRFPLHWTGVDHSVDNSGAHPVDIGFENRRLDVLFTIPRGPPGCWPATAKALSLADTNGHYFPPGSYEAVLTLKPEGAKGITVNLAFSAPERWDDWEPTILKTSRGAIAQPS